jgi:hypothetical protein
MCGNVHHVIADSSLLQMQITFFSPFFARLVLTELGAKFA